MSTDIWDKLTSAFGKNKKLWKNTEFKIAPTKTDRLINYLIFYYTNAGTARKALRKFKGLDGGNYSGWDEVRVATLREIESTLQECGGNSNTWELAITIKDFLQNAWDTILTCELDSALIQRKPTEIDAFIKQLSGKKDAWKKDKPSPFRPLFSTFNRRKLRKDESENDEPVLPGFAIMYLKFLLNKSNTAPFEYHCEKVLIRLGNIKKENIVKYKKKVYNELLGKETPINKHKSLIKLSKLVCLKKNPRCTICPLTNECKSKEI